MLAMVFDCDTGAISGAELRPDGREIGSARFVSPSAAGQLLDAATFNRVTAALSARTTRETPYLEGGSPPDR